MRRIVIALQAVLALFLLGAGSATAMRHPALRRPPELRAAGATLRWSRLPHVSNYLVAVVGGRHTTFRVVHGTRATVSPRPGRTVAYRVRARVRHARWSRAVTIRWPRLERASLDTRHLKVSVENTTGWNVDAIFGSAGVRYERLDVGDGRDLTLVKQALSDGMTPLVLYDPGPNGSLEGVSPAVAAAQVVSLGQRLTSLAAAFPSLNQLHVIEFGNEVYRDEGSTAYAAQYDAAHRALAATGLGSWKLLAAATAVCGAMRDTDWIPGFIARMSSGPGEVDGWTVHPYGAMNTDATPDCAGPHGYGWPDLRDWHRIAVAHGSNAPWYVTEVGQCISAGYACPNIVDPATQATDLTRYLNDAASYPWVVFFNWYTSCDDSSGGYGLLNENAAHVCGADGPFDRRPAFDALARWISANGEGSSPSTLAVDGDPLLQLGQAGSRVVDGLVQVASVT